MKEEFKMVYDQLTLSEEANQKLLNLKPSEKKVKKYRIRYVAVAALILGIYFTSDMVTYAATGKPLTQHIYNNLTSPDKNGDTKLKDGDAKLKDGSKVHVDIEEDTPFEVNVYEIANEESNENGVQIDIGNKKEK